MYRFFLRVGIWINERTGGEKGQCLCVRCARSDHWFCRSLCTVIGWFDKDHCENVHRKDTS